MNARGSGAVPRDMLVFDKVRGRIFKARGRKIQIIGKEIQSQGKRIPSFFLPRIGPFQGLAGESKSRAAVLPDSTLGGRRRRARTCEDAPSQRLATRMEPRLLRKSRPAHARLASGPTCGLWGTRISYSTDLENRKQKSHGTARLSAITHG